ncbi:hypothetical protein SAMN05421823_10851 [Catalinimonas alkaloidigena]|uniref:Por secretion system C-terminal sorting domain-containing protein n=1 Tax=Catalinimonas alkaloidigena TaxID=1075417 RepID=A0A1G9MPU9_9BACT|nr:hypothetical protein [Catalinimonas alkaloidigena]SDL76249.1 hypothetical protein SAMN05421823_10851 [Catalinimonas alkaloidigena]
MKTLTTLLVTGLLTVAGVRAQDALPAQHQDDIVIALSVDDASVYRLYYPISDGDKAKVKVSVYNEEGGHLYTDRIHSQRTFVRRYNLSQLPSGEYTFKIKNKEETREVVVFHHEQDPNAQLALDYELPAGEQVIVKSKRKAKRQPEKPQTPATQQSLMYDND